MVKKQSLKEILSIIEKRQPVKANEIFLISGKSRVLIHKYLKAAIEYGLIIKHGKAPHVFYSIAKKTNNKIKNTINFSEQQLLDQRFCNFDVNGERLDGNNGFVSRCQMRNLDIQKTFLQFKTYIKNINSLRDSCGIIHKGFEKFQKQVEESMLEDLLYLDVYQIGHFGRSRLGNIAFYAKQSQSTSLFNELITLTKNQIDCLILNHDFDTVCFAPHSLKRNIQILNILKNKRKINLPEIKLRKLYKSDIIIPQKSIKGTKQRIRNAQETIFVINDQKPVKNLLLIDDFVGSGATLNESARKIKQVGLAKNITGLALVGNIDMSYDVINEV